MDWSNRDDVRKYHNAWKLKHKARLKQKRLDNIDSERAKSRARRARNAEKITAYNREWRKNHPAEIKAYYRKYRLKSEYNMTPAEFKRISLAQGGLCWICDAKPKVLSVDHDHKTGSVRGLICKDCNLGIGFFKDSRDLLRRTIRYLMHFQDSGDSTQSVSHAKPPSVRGEN